MTQSQTIKKIHWLHQQQKKDVTVIKHASLAKKARSFLTIT